MIPLFIKADPKAPELPCMVAVFATDPALRTQYGLQPIIFRQEFQDPVLAYRAAQSFVAPGHNVNIFARFREERNNKWDLVKRSWHNNNDEGWRELELHSSDSTIPIVGKIPDFIPGIIK